ncbi:hypothetical protein P8610_10370 [Fictibacillus sp. UD]|uniref:hypothetical protein n=1 Tax=Fictibacillus sp. UD TaxID=3038777 RepID=UPI0037455EAA
MLDQKLLLELETYLNERLIMELEVCKSSEIMEESLEENSLRFELDEFIHKNRKPTLQEKLFQLIDQKDVLDTEVYKKAGLDRKHFSKIRSKTDYRPKKNTILALALALELNEENTEELLETAGYSLSDSDTNDLIFRFCINKKIYDRFEVNEYLVHFSLTPIGSSI